LQFGYSFCYISKNWAIFFKVLVTLARKDKQSGLFGLLVSDEEKKVLLHRQQVFIARSMFFHH
jgi:Trp operon repressor